jgi:transcriptional regulator with XRE-family HTH domain
MTMGKLIEKARMAKGLSLEKLGKKIGVSRQLVWQWEKDETDPSKHIKELSEHLGVPVEYFYGPKRAPGILAAKIKQLSPDKQELIENLIDNMLRQQEQESAPETDVK